MKDIMLDIETLGNGDRAAIVQIAACYFDRSTGAIGYRFDSRISLSDACHHGEVDGKTIAWWLTQDPEVMRKVMSGTDSLSSALWEFQHFIHRVENHLIWSHATFDFVIINNAMRRMNIPGLNYKSARDLRTLVDLAGMTQDDYPKSGKTHNALDDCFFQVQYAVKAFDKIHQMGS